MIGSPLFHCPYSPTVMHVGHCLLSSFCLQRCALYSTCAHAFFCRIGGRPMIVRKFSNNGFAITHIYTCTLQIRAQLIHNFVCLGRSPLKSMIVFQCSIHLGLSFTTLPCNIAKLFNDLCLRDLPPCSGRSAWLRRRGSRT
jgi:hypothetical protein